MRIRLSKALSVASLVVVLAHPSVVAALPQQRGAGPNPAPAISSTPSPKELDGRRTPLGTQVKPPKPVEPEPPRERLDQALTRALTAAGGRAALNAIEDSVATGTLTDFDAAGKVLSSSAVTLTRKGDGPSGKVQRVVYRQGRDVKSGTDGTVSWDGWAGFTTQAAGASLAFLESQTVRSVRNLWDADSKGSSVRDLGVRKGAGRDDRVVEVEDRDGRKTRYFVDDATGNVVRLEFVTGESRSPFGGAVRDNTEAFTFSDFRTVRGVQTPFTVEHYRNGQKVEEMRFTSIQHNASVKDSTFKR